mmetsp:Transcript_19566/g.32174  ORF Transcript_19566/g.32174 Transcript_19566/m.32174 type:complete len:82 (+) Transcript_19566:200-445(+)
MNVGIFIACGVSESSIRGESERIIHGQLSKPGQKAVSSVKMRLQPFPVKIVRIFTVILVQKKSTGKVVELSMFFLNSSLKL